MAKIDIIRGEVKEGDILFDKNTKRKVATVTLNRPEKLNAMTLAHWMKLRDIFLEVDEDEDVKVLIIKGSGRALCSGHDVSNIGFQHGIGGTGKAGERRASQRSRLIVDMDYFHGRRGIMTTLCNCRKVTLVQAQGFCYGGGFYLVVQADMAIAAEDALFTHPGWRYIGPTTDPWAVFAHLGWKRTKQLMLTGTPIDARKALEWGLVNEVVPLSKLEEEVNKTADKVAKLPMDAVVMGKQQLQCGLEAMGMHLGETFTGLVHALQTQIRFEEGEFNLLKERRDKGSKGAILARKAYYGEGSELAGILKK